MYVYDFHLNEIEKLASYCFLIYMYMYGRNGAGVALTVKTVQIFLSWVNVS